MSGGGVPELEAIGAGLTTAFNIAKAVVSADRAIDKAELKLRMSELMVALAESRQELIDARSTAQVLEARLRQLESNAALVATLRHKAPFYFAEGDATPYCARCVEVERRPVHVVKTTMVSAGKRVWECPSCKTKVADMHGHAIDRTQT